MTRPERDHGEEPDEDDKPVETLFAYLLHDLRNVATPLLADLEVARMHTRTGRSHALSPLDRDRRERLFREAIEGAYSCAMILEDALSTGLHILKASHDHSNKPYKVAPLVIRVARLVKVPGEASLRVGRLPSAQTTVAPFALVRVLINLLQNAVDSCRDRADGLVCLSSWEAKGELFLEVADNGPGIPKGQHEAIFDLFHSQRHGGMGVGLHATREFVDGWGGSIRVESIPNQATRFIVSLPTVAD